MPSKYLVFKMSSKYLKNTQTTEKFWQTDVAAFLAFDWLTKHFWNYWFQLKDMKCNVINVAFKYFLWKPRYCHWLSTLS